ncbi:hypothetical protein BM477_02585 [Boudabousia marimammalium]|uniref:Uncharacterized protein n=1 Tax=Boudabousia marimammalium TaxID=156892 RepID=A0A1Q5PS21_9ACTO|nr:hypothetical protein BM477_02585 [Boudabousia marimammalium]
MERYYRPAPTIKEAWAQPGLINKVMHLLQWWNGTRIGRTLTRYGIQRGALMSGGIAYSALFSIGAGLTIAWTAFMYFVGDNAALRLRVIKSVNVTMPGLLSTPSKGGLVDPADLVMDNPINLATIIAVVLLLFAATYVMANLKIAIRSMFGISYFPSNFFGEKLRDLLGFVLLAVSVLLTTGLGFVVSALGNYFLDLLGVTGSASGILLKGVSLLTAGLVDAGIWCMLVAFISGVKVPLKELLTGGIIFGVFAGIIRYLGTAAVSSVSDKPLLASVAAFATLLLWVNLLSRVAQMVAAWTANPPAPAYPNDAAQVHMNERPNYVTLSKPETLEWPHQKVTGTMDVDQSGDPYVEVAEETPLEPRFGGLIGAYQRHRMARLEAKLEKARANYYQPQRKQ